MPKRPQNEGRLKLPLSFDEALADLLKVKPPPKNEKVQTSDRKRKRKDATKKR